MPKVYYDTQGNIIPPSDLKYRVRQNYNQFVNEPLLGKPQPISAPTEIMSEESTLDPIEVAKRKELGDDLMKRAAEEEQLKMQKNAETQKLRDMETLNNYNRMLGQQYQEAPVQSGKVSDAEAASLASEFTKQPTRFKNLKKTMGK